MEEVVEFLEVEHRVRVRYIYLSPLGLCLVQFHSLIVRQIFVDQSSLQLDVEREVIIQEHVRGINVHSCPFTRTCWVMFLAFLLDFQTREIISQVVSLFGSVATWTNNHRCKSRILIQCKVTLVSRVPRSVLICEGNPIGDNRSSRSVPVFVLSDHHNDVLTADEDQIPPNGNPHLLTITFYMQNQSLAILYLISLRISVTSIISSNKMLMKAWKSPRSQIRVTMMVGAHGYGKKVN